jgi:hypothetical protein
MCVLFGIFLIHIYTVGTEATGVPNWAQLKIERYFKDVPRRAKRNYLTKAFGVCSARRQLMGQASF